MVTILQFLQRPRTASSTRRALAVCVLVAAGLAGPVSAQQAATCESYANTALDQNRRNQALGCGYGGAGWSDDYAAHETWCLQPGVGREELAHEYNAREEALQFCVERGASCDAYANLAVLQNQAAIDKGCGFTGGRWSADYAGHRQWCMAVRPEDSVAEVEIRDQALGQCGGQLNMLQIQDLLSRQSQMVQMMSNIMKKMSDTNNAIIQNWK